MTKVTSWLLQMLRACWRSVRQTSNILGRDHNGPMYGLSWLEGAFIGTLWFVGLAIFISLIELLTQ